ncbi:DUF624 domain-containing protein [Paenalkalicoccus suaedae]|uniref:DUF624 domain-containing protein n=1 Tax=Paenalkalicoccus suaedae TaxID=2592382 RepID=A0A859FBV7_9BACI|nr:DUF624 domain-containing protein [Paenalkalicoccus suaedae]QKS70024.1 DUF624 domain-containing protein [Paenalkalicoccus suaedae]
MTAKVEEMLRVITRFAGLNLIWILATLMGLVVLGLFPATYVLFATVQKWLNDGGETPVVKSFLASYKQGFWRANVAGWLLAAVGAVLYTNYQLLATLGGEMPLLVVIAFLLIVTLYVLTVVTIFPIWSYYEGDLKSTFRVTMQFILGKLHVAVGLAAVLWGGVYLSLAFPALILFFSGSVLAYLLAWFITRSIDRLYDKQQLKQTGRQLT